MEGWRGGAHLFGEVVGVPAYDQMQVSGIPGHTSHTPAHPGKDEASALAVAVANAAVDWVAYEGTGKRFVAVAVAFPAVTSVRGVSGVERARSARFWWEGSGDGLGAASTMGKSAVLRQSVHTMVAPVNERCK